MSDKDNHFLFEMYKLHSELAERVASLRENLNKLYSGMVTSIVAASVLLYRLVPNAETTWILPSLGILVSISWLFALHSITGRLSAKHHVLVSLEAQLPFNFLVQEDEEFNKSRVLKRKYTGAVMPGSFLLLCIAWLVFLFTLCKE